MRAAASGPQLPAAPGGLRTAGQQSITMSSHFDGITACEQCCVATHCIASGRSYGVIVGRELQA
jgi:hypothetical protein